MRAVLRLGWLLPALAIPASAGLLALGLQAAAFGRPTPDALLSAHVLRDVLRYRVMRATEDVGGKYVKAICIYGWYRVPERRRVSPVSLVLLNNGERLYDAGNGVERVGLRGHIRSADFERFLLAGCPRILTGRLGSRLVNGHWIDADIHKSLVVLQFGDRAKPVQLTVAAGTYNPLALQLRDWPIAGSSRLHPGGGGPAVSLVRRAFRFPTTNRARHA